MTTSHHYNYDCMSHLTETLYAFAEAGTDPAIGTETEELERPFAEPRRSHTRDGN